jgi:hypothetical protein
MPYRTSPPLARWLDVRRRTIEALAAVHAAVGAGREAGRPVAQAYALRVVAEFQAFARELHGYGADRLVTLAEPRAVSRPALWQAATARRALDRGNADLGALERDFDRLGLDRLPRRIRIANPRWVGSAGSRGDRAFFADLLELRNSLAHGDERQLDRLRARGVADTVDWARSCLPALDRLAGALDLVLWQYLADIYGRDPW